MAKTNTIHHRRKVVPLTQRFRSHRPLRLYSVLATIVALGLLVNATWLRGTVLSYATNVSPAGLLAATNQQRTANGKAALVLNSQLTQAATAKAADMISRDYWSHNTPDGQAPWVFVTNAGYGYTAIAENLAYGFSDSDSVVTGWMNSAGHRTNMLNDTYVDVGFGSADGPNYQGNGNQTVVVAFYGKTAATPAPVQQSAPVVSPPAPAAPVQPVTAPSQPTVPSPPVVTSVPEPAPSAPQAAAPVPSPNKTPTTAEPASSGSQPVTTSPQSISRFQLQFGPFATVVASVSLLGAGGMGLMFALRHSLAWHRTLIQGEQFVLHHKAIDIAIVGFIMASLVMIQAIGMIR